MSDDEILDTATNPPEAIEDGEAGATSVDRSDASEPTTVREALESAWKEHGGDVPDRPDRARAEDGKFRKETRAEKRAKAAPQQAAPGPIGENVPKSSSTIATDQGAVGVPQEPASGPPQGWSKEAQAEWAKLPPHIQAAVTKREQDMSKGAQQIRERYGFVHQLTNAITPYCQKYQRTPAQAFEQLASWWVSMERDPHGTIQALAQSYGINLANPGASAQSQQGVQPSNAQPRQADPRVEAAMQEINNLKIAEANRQASQTYEMLRQWGSAKPHFAAVRQIMAQVIAGAAHTNDTSILDQTGQRIDLDKVYDRAVYMVPEVRAAVLKEQQQAEAAARKQQADQARRVAASAKPGSPGVASRGNGAKPPRRPGLSDIRADIMAAIEEHRS